MGGGRNSIALILPQSLRSNLKCQAPGHLRIRSSRYRSPSVQTTASGQPSTTLLDGKAQHANAHKPAKLPMTPFQTTIPKPFTPQQQLLSWHLRLGHVQFDILKQAPQQGTLPASLQKANNPICPSCKYGKQTKT